MDGPQLGPYQLIRSLGEGGMGEVSLAYDPRLGRQVAIKRITAGAVDPIRRARFLREARLAANLQHPAIVQVFDLLTLDHTDYIVMELVPGGSLRQKLVGEGRLPLTVGLACMRSVAEGLAYAHEQRVIHRDLKSENVLLGHTGQAKITDFGIARRLNSGQNHADHETLTKEGATLGTVRAMSPEQVRGYPLDTRSDLFSFGVLCYEMFTGASPFLGANNLATATRIVGFQQPPAHTVCHDLPPDLGCWIDRLLEKEVANRPESAHQIIDWLAKRELDADRVAVRQPLHAVPTGAMASSDGGSFEAGAAVDAERRQVTILACELFDREDSQASIEWDPFYDVMDELRIKGRPIFERFGGWVGEDPGHRLIVYFGYPTSREHDGRNAVLAAFELLACFRALGTVRRGSDRLEIRAGVHTGAVVVATRRGERQLLPGATIDQAIAVQQHADSGEVLVSEATHALAADAIETVPAPAIHHTGWPRPLAVYRARPALHRPSADDAAADRVCVGREVELGWLRAAWQGVVEGGAGRCMVILGSAGIGKSHLLRTLRPDVGPKQWLECRASARGEHVAFHAVHSLVHQMFGIGDQMDPSEQVERLRAGLEDLGIGAAPEVAPLPLLAALLSLSVTGVDEAPQQPQNRRAHTLELLVTLVTSLAARRPLVLALEDVHWFDPSSLDVLDRLAAGLSAVPVLLLLTSRRRLACWADADWTTDEVPLGRLGRNHVIEQIGRRVGVDSLPDEAVEQIVERAGGVPLFVDQLTRMFVRGGVEVSSEERFGSGDGGTNPIPASLRASLAVRLDQTGEARELAQIASVIGRDFPLWLLEAVAGRDEATLRKNLDGLVHGGLLRRRDSSRQRYQFEHVLIQEAAYQTLLDGARRTWHARIASAIESRVFGAEQASTIIEDATTARRAGAEIIDGLIVLPQLAHHWMRAIDRRRPAVEPVRRAVRFTRRAVEEELQISAYREALEKIETMLALLKRLPQNRSFDELELELRLPQIAVHKVVFGIGSNEVKRSYDRARQLCQQLGERAELSQLLFGLGIYHQWNAEHQKSMVLAEELLAHARKVGDLSLLEEAHMSVFNASFWLWNVEAVLHHGARVLELHDPALDEVHIVQYGHDPRIVVFQLTICLLWQAGHRRLAECCTRELEQLLEGIEHPYSVLLGDLALLVTDYRRHDFEAMRVRAEKLVDLASRMQSPIFALDGELFATWARIQKGEHDLIDHHCTLFEARRATTNRIAESSFLVLSATALERGGRHAEAVELLEDAESRGIGAHEVPQEAELRLILGRVRYAAADDDVGRRHAETTLREAYELADTRGQGLIVEAAAAFLAKILNADGKTDEARALIRRSARRSATIKQKIERLAASHRRWSRFLNSEPQRTEGDVR